MRWLMEMPPLEIVMKHKFTTLFRVELTFPTLEGRILAIKRISLLFRSDDFMSL